MKFGSTATDRLQLGSKATKKREKLNLGPKAQTGRNLAPEASKKQRRPGNGIQAGKRGGDPKINEIWLHSHRQAKIRFQKPPKSEEKLNLAPKAHPEATKKQRKTGGESAFSTFSAAKA